MVTKKVRTEYMKKFRDPKWETFSKCYEDSLRYRLTRRVLEHSHKPWFWEGWDSGSLLSSGRSTPKSASWPGRNRVSPLVAVDEADQARSGSDARPPSERAEEMATKAATTEAAATEVTEVADVDATAPAEAPTENVVSAPPNSSIEPDTDDGPLDPPDSNGDPAEPAPTQRRRHNPSHSERELQNVSPVDLKSQRAKSQPPPGGANDNLWRRCNDAYSRKAATPNNNGRCDACVQTTKTSLRRRARSADPDKMRRSQQHRLTASATTVIPAVTTDERWVTEYMRCFSARLR
ncbi:centriole, cilia and spindle-associated protein isoform X2 [Corythoichthys intestinalis]|uniref:centriole, cilia and spindle-associated protein isoform X2 n=1 Tax=Corythoichthys intestinalis TaxID=161448 RepID=UPI0025A531E9|nr:centriole, cilia and spindle-associated protein isoform X2 [Corythoichthys intestinalis]